METPPPVSIAYAALRCKCPACGKGDLFRKLLKVADTCPHCGLSLKPYDQGDGPASLSILLIGGLVGIMASIVEVKYEPPFWVHGVLWIPLIVVGSLVSLRWVKGGLIAMQYQFRRDDATKETPKD